MKKRDFGAFLGCETAINPRYGNPLRSQDELNCLHENGSIKPRYGYRNLDTATANFATSHGLFYIQGYTSGNALTEEYISAERLSTDTSSKFRLYSRNVTTGAETVLTDGVSGVEITFASTPSSTVPYADVMAVPWQSDCYIVCPANATTLYKHTIGTATSLTAMAVPADPSTALTWIATYNGSGATLYDTMLFSAQDASSSGEVAVTGLATNTGSGASSTDGSMTVRHTAGSGGGAASFQADLSDGPGDQDWTYNDAIAFTLTEDVSGAFKIDPATLQVQAINGGSTTLNFEVIAERVGTSNVIKVWCYAPAYKTRSDWGTISEFKVSYTVTARSGTAANNDLTISKVYIGCTFPAPVSERTPGTVVSFAYSYYFSTPTLESGFGTSVIDIPVSQLRGYDPLGGGLHTLGVFPKFTNAASADSNVDNMRLYWFDDRTPMGTTQDPFVWRRIVTQNDATGTYTLKMSYQELVALTAYSNVNAFATSNLIGVFPWRQTLVWLYKGGYQNVKVSRVGDPLKQASTTDDVNDVSRGATFSLADNAGDQPVGCGFEVDDAMMIPGSNGVYAAVGTLPFELTPFKRLPGSYGCPNAFAACKATFNGVPGVCAVSKNGSGCYLYLVSSQFDGNTGFKIEELTEKVRPSIMDFLVSPQVTGSYADVPTALANIRCVFDESEDSLWIILGTRAMKLGRPSLETGEREWEFYSYTVAGSGLLQWVSTSTRRRMKWLRSTGLIDENYYNSSTNAYIEGSTRDGGSAMPTPYWTTKIAAGERRRFMWAHIRKTTSTNTPTITVITDENTFGPYSVATGKQFVKGFGNAVGREIAYKLTLSEGDAAYLRGEIYESEPIGDRRWA